MKNQRNDNITDYFQIGRMIAVLYRAGQTFFTHQPNHLDIGGGQISLIFYLYKHDGASQDELTKALEVDKATITRTLHKLEELGIVERQRDVSDHRVNRIVLTERGHAHQSELSNSAKEWHSTLLKDFTDEELENLQFLFEKLSHNARTFKSTLNKKNDKDV